MPNVIDPNHICLTSTYTVSELANPIFQKHNINYFQFFRAYKDGSVFNLTNNAKWLSYAWNDQAMPVMSTVDATIIDPEFYTFLWDTHLPQKPLALAREHFDIANGLCFVFRQKEWYELIAFATPKSNYSALDRYFNYQHELLAFILNFRHAAATLIDQAYKSRIYLPLAMQDSNKQILLNNRTTHYKQGYPIVYRNTKSHLTSQEFSCLKQLALGKTIKEIAFGLQLSSRTVETYINRVKTRLDIHQRKDLITLIQCP